MMADSSETFGYDALDRLTSSEVKTATASAYDVSESYVYDASGNLTQKGSSTYTYTGCVGGLHAVCQVQGATGDPIAYTYDGNGNATIVGPPGGGAGKVIGYNASNRTTHIADTLSDSSVNDVDFIYGADGNRVVQSVGTAAGGESARTVYVGLGGTGKSVYERTTTAGTTEHVHFIYAGSAHGGNAFALKVKTISTGTQDNGGGASTSTPAPTEVTKYYHFDHLWSVTAMSDDVGSVVSPVSGVANTTLLGYDPWGLRRNPDGSAGTTPPDLLVGHREFTSHETIPTMTLVNMNGRVYDPELGRFLSADPNVSVAADLQAYNRYSYVANNPLRYTDPTGYSWYSFLTSPSFWEAAVETIVSIECAAATGGACIGLAAAFLVMNSVQMAVSGASFGQIVKLDAIGAFASVVGGSIGGAMGQNLGLGQVLGGAIGGALTTAISVPLSGGSLGKSVLLQLAEGAAIGAATAAVLPDNPVSQRDQNAQQGGGTTDLEAGATRRPVAGAAGNWAQGNVDALFNENYTGFSQEFIDRMQPVFDKLNLDVDLSQVSVEFGGAKTLTVGYDITFQGGELTGSFNDVLGDTLHELGHVVQFENAPGETWADQIEAVKSLAGIQKYDAVRMYGDSQAAYLQDPYLANESLGQLAGTKLLNPSFTIESQADRFRDILLSSSGWGQ
jgi:RHS repeat-associated protein